MEQVKREVESLSGKVEHYYPKVERNCRKVERERRIRTLELNCGTSEARSRKLES